ncbi:hypothetical protein [Thalassotalea marina]|uniref:Uncharacterized protein n=1 Tax=Thalassotalea marina TaxID=1673741 RepID=A0A919EQF6_9GAMM|nr:hypothetical protein [Thalassotalea marina]GHG07833.1 hypothetical protein GCM10017161_41990 [Thalassotalea marina]
MNDYKSSDILFFAFVLTVMLFTSPGGGLLLVIVYLLIEGFSLRKKENLAKENSKINKNKQ